MTAYDQHALRAFEFHALDYLLKPFDRQRFAETFKRAKAHINRQLENHSTSRILSLLEQINSEQSKYLEWLTVKKDERIRLFKTEDVRWIEAQGGKLFWAEEMPDLIAEEARMLWGIAT